MSPEDYVFSGLIVLFTKGGFINYYCPVKITNCFWLNSIYLMAVCSYIDLNKVYVLFVPTKRTKKLCAWALS